MNLAVATIKLLLLCSAVLMPLPCLATQATGESPPDLHLNEPQSTTILVRVVSHGSMVLGREVGNARVTITDVATKQILATGIQEGDAGDQNHIMRTPRLMEEPHYSSRPAAAFSATFDLLRPSLVEVTAEEPLRYNRGRARFEAPFFVSFPNDAPNGITLRVVAADPPNGNFGANQTKFPVLSERLPPGSR